MIHVDQNCTNLKALFCYLCFSVSVDSNWLFFFNSFVRFTQTYSHSQWVTCEHFYILQPQLRYHLMQLRPHVFIRSERWWNVCVFAGRRWYPAVCEENQSQDKQTASANSSDCISQFGWKYGSSLSSFSSAGVSTSRMNPPHPGTGHPDWIHKWTDSFHHRQNPDNNAEHSHLHTTSFRTLGHLASVNTVNCWKICTCVSQAFVYSELCVNMS